MRKSTIFISAILTTFALVMLYGVVSAYQSYANLPEATPLPTATVIPDTPEPDPALEPAVTQAVITPEQAARLAAQVAGNPNLFSAESWNLNGTNAYKITFTNNDVVYIGLDGQVLGVQIAPVIANVSAPVQQVKHKNKDNNNTSSQSHEEHEDEHEDEDEDEDEDH